MADSNSILGRGWSFPVSFNGRTVQLSEEEKDIKESLVILLNTTMGERVMRPDYGTSLENMIFESINVTTASIIINRLKRAILFHEPRITNTEIDLVPDINNGFIEITVSYTIIATNSRTNLVYPYFLNEGTNL
jgi:phage baseplate assembly protein W